MPTKVKPRKSGAKVASSRKKTSSSRSKPRSARKTQPVARAVPSDMRDLTRTVKAMFKKAGRDPWDTADMLNKKKIRTLNGKPFTARRVSVYVK